MTLLKTEGITKKFGELVAVDKLSVEIEEKDVFGLIGPNGAGKTTFFNLISGFLKPDSGKIIFKGKNITSKEPHEIANMGMARTYQKLNLFWDSTVTENIEAGLLVSTELSEDERMERAIEIAKEIGIEKDHLDENIRDVGQAVKRITELGRTLAREPEILLLDEVVAGLDSEEVERILDVLRDVNESGKTIFMIEHRMKAIMSVADKILTLHSGEKLTEGTPKEVQSNEEVQKIYLGGGKFV